jgi:hypothetical protein
MARSPLFSRPRPDGGTNIAAPIRSRKVRKVLKLEARAARLLARHERALACAAPLLTRADALRREAWAAELALTGTELGELRRARSGAPR